MDRVAHISLDPLPRHHIVAAADPRHFISKGDTFGFRRNDHVMRRTFLKQRLCSLLRDLDIPEHDKTGDIQCVSLIGQIGSSRSQPAIVIRYTSCTQIRPLSKHQLLPSHRLARRPLHLAPAGKWKCRCCTVRCPSEPQLLTTPEPVFQSLLPGKLCGDLKICATMPLFSGVISMQRQYAPSAQSGYAPAPGDRGRKTRKPYRPHKQFLMGSHDWRFYKTQSMSTPPS